MRKIFLGLLLGTLSGPAIAFASGPPAANLPALGETPRVAPEPIAASNEVKPAPRPPAVNPEPRPPQQPAATPPATPTQTAAQPLGMPAPMTAPAHHHAGPVRVVGAYVDWIFTRGRIIVVGFPTEHDVHKRAAEPQAYTLPQTKPAPPCKRGLFFHR